MKLNLIILGIIAITLSASSCAERSLQQDQKNAELKKLNESTIASGFDQIRVANKDPENKPDPKMMHYALNYKGKQSGNWQEADSASKALLSNYFKPNNKWPEIQFVCLNMLKNYLNPTYSNNPNNKAIQTAIKFYLDQAMEAKAEDWDVLVKSMLSIKDLYSAEKWNSYKVYIITNSKKDLKLYREKLKNLDTSNDPVKNKARTESHYQHVIHDAEYALAHLSER